MILLFDTETTSLHPGQICQLSYITVTDTDGSRRPCGECEPPSVRKTAPLPPPDVEVKAHNFFFAVDEIDPASAAVNGLSVERLAEFSGGRRFEDDLFAFHGDFETADAVVAHNFVFDMIFMNAEYGRVGDVFRVKRRFDTMRHFTPVLKLPSVHNPNGWKFPRLTELTAHYGLTEEAIAAETARLFGCEGSAAHDARYDTTALYLLLSAAAADLPPEMRLG